jgi:hypothetical protein
MVPGGSEDGGTALVDYFIDHEEQKYSTSKR